MNGHRICFLRKNKTLFNLPVFIPLQKLNCFLLFWRRSFPVLGYLASSSVFHSSSLRNLTRNSTGVFILSVRKGWVMRILQLGFCSLHFFQSLGWLFYTLESFTRYGPMVNRRRGSNRFEHVMLSKRPRPHVSGYFWKRRFFSPHPHVAYSNRFRPLYTKTLKRLKYNSIPY